jgi:hypothetical protein
MAPKRLFITLTENLCPIPIRGITDMLIVRRCVPKVCIVVFLLCTTGLSSGGVALQTQPENGDSKSRAKQVLGTSDDVVAVKATAILEQTVAHRYSAIADIGAFDSGSRVKVKLDVANPGQQTIELNEATVNCSCSRFDAFQKSIPSYQTAQFQMDFPIYAPDENGNGVSSVTLAGKSGKLDVQISIQIKFQVRNFLRFANHSTTFEFRENENLLEREIFFQYTDPIVPEALKVAADGGLKSAVAQIRKNDSGRYYVALEIPSSEVKAGPILGTLRLFDPESEGSCLIIIRANPYSPIAVSPRVLRFRKLSETSSVYTAAAILKVKSDGIESADALKNQLGVRTEAGKLSSIVSRNLNIEAYGKLGAGEKKPIRVRLQKLSERIYRMTFEFDPSEEPSENIFNEDEIFPIEFLAKIGDLDMLISDLEGICSK